MRWHGRARAATRWSRPRQADTRGLPPRNTQRTSPAMARSSLAGMSCLFCEIVAGKASAIRIYEDEDYLAILDIRPFTRGHTLVFPKRHTVDLTDTPPDTCTGMLGIGQRIARAARAPSLNADGNNVVISDGRAAFQSVMHIHLHVVPRRNGDKLSFVKGMMLRRDPNLETTGRILREALKKIDTTG